MAEFGNLRKDFAIRRKSLLADLDKTMGISSESLRELRFFKEGMRQGLVSFEPAAGRDGSFGKLSVTTKVKGETKVHEFTIESPQEAAFLLGLKSEIQKDSSK